MSRYTGFTLMEMLVVLMLLGLALTLSVPRVESIYRSVQLALNLEEFKLAVQRLPERARLAGEPIHITRLDPVVATQLGIPLLSGWEVKIVEPIVISDQGFCTGGIFALDDGRSAIRYVLRQPYCRVEELAQ
jgi:prepilin-type N-terminal cleavage/methylation domain-containing protein